MTRRRKLVFWSAGLLALGVLAVAAVSWRLGSTLLAPANYAVGPPPTHLPIEETTLDSQSGAQIAAWYIPAEDSTATVVLLHPIRGSRLTMLTRAELFRQWGFSVVLVDLQASGESPGEHITAGYLERHDAAAAVAFARQRNPGGKVVVVGWSLGGAAALLGSPLGVDAMILESVYPTIEEAIRDRIAIRLGGVADLLSPLLVWQLKPRLGISPSELRPIERIAQVGCPVLVMGGQEDRHTTIEETRRLYAVAREPKQLQVFSRAGHVDLLKTDDMLYERVVAGFLHDCHVMPGREAPRLASPPAT
jgi:pimeloyl-ACP methyl ester carboxylesterase